MSRERFNVVKTGIDIRNPLPTLSSSKRAQAEQFNDMFRSLCYEPFSDVAIIVGNSLATVFRSSGL